MGRRSTSARLIGREGELAELLAATRADDPERPVILVSGEAGIGKTRLLAEVANRLRESDDGSEAVQVVRGSSLRLAEGELPFAPFLEILDALRGSASGGDIARLRALLAGAGPDETRSAESRTLRFLETHDAIVRRAEDSRLAIMLDDLHWADRSTLDLVLFLARRLRAARVVLIAAYRSDELHRRHPLRSIIAELVRGYVRARVDLVPLDGDSVRAQIEELGGTPRDIKTIVERADGNPFYVEELVALGPTAARLPETVRDVLLARLTSLEPEIQRVLDACAVIGRAADENLISTVLELDAGSVIDALHAAVDHSILVPASDGRTYRFRHALLEEAVQDDLLPAARVDLHRRVSAALRGLETATPGSVTPGELARHLDLAGQTGAATEAHIEAARVAYRALAWAEGIASFERAAVLAATAASGGPEQLRDLVVPTALALNWTGNAGRSIALLREWIARVEAAGDAASGTALWMALSRVLTDSGAEAESRMAVEAAARIGPVDASTAVGVDLLIGLARNAWMPGRTREALRIAEQAVIAAEVLGDPMLLFQALVHRGEARIALGDLDLGLEDVTRLRRLQDEHGWLDTYGYLAPNVAMALAETGLLDLALDLSREGLQLSQRLGISRSWDPWNLPGLALHAYLSGRWTEADGPLTRAREFGASGAPSVYNEFVAALLAAGRGDLVACDAAIAIADANAGDLFGEWIAELDLARAARAEAADDPQRRLAAARAGLDTLEGFDSFVMRSRQAAEAASAAADLAAALVPRRDAARINEARQAARWAATYAADLDAGRVVPGTRSVPWTHLNSAVATAEAARAEGSDDAAAWAEIAEGFAAIGMMPRVAYAYFRGGAASLAGGDRSRAEALLRQAHGLAGSIGMVVLERRIVTLARAARITLDRQPAPVATQASARGDPWGLSTREREVLALLADGRTNGEIGARLYISPKTASVHVTHILDKLGVSSRTEAAILASQAGLLA